MRFKILLILLPALLAGQSFFNRTLGADTPSYSIRSQGMGNTTSTSSLGISAILSNPALLGKTESRFNAILNHSGISILERRSIILKDFFGDFLTEGDYLNNSLFMSNISGGFSYKVLTEKINLDLGLHLGGLLSFQTEYKEEVRGEADCPDGIACTRDVLAGYHQFESDGKVNVVSGGFSAGIDLGIGQLSLGVSRHQTLETDLKSMSGTDTLNYVTDNLSAVPSQDINISIENGSFFSFGSSLKFHNGLMITISREDEVILRSNGLGNFGVYNLESGLIEYFMDCSTLLCSDSLITQEPILLSQPVIRPTKSSIGLLYSPLNSIPMTLVLEYELREFSQPSLTSLNQYTEFLLSSNTDSSFSLQPDISLRSSGSIKTGIEYTTLNRSILRAGLQYLKTPLPGFSPQSILTFGFGKIYNSLSINIAGYYKMIKYSYPDVFKVAGEYRQDYDTVRESTMGFSVGIFYSF